MGADEDANGNKAYEMAPGDYKVLLAEAEAHVPEARMKKQKIEEYIKKSYEAQQAAAAGDDDDDDDDEEDYYGDEDDEEDVVDEEIEEADLTFDWDEDDDDDDEGTGESDEFHDEL